MKRDKRIFSKQGVPMKSLQTKRIGGRFAPAQTADARFTGDGLAPDVIAPTSSQRKKRMGNVASDRSASGISRNIPSIQSAGARFPGDGLAREVIAPVSSQRNALTPTSSQREKRMENVASERSASGISRNIPSIRSAGARFPGDGLAREAIAPVSSQRNELTPEMLALRIPRSIPSAHGVGARLQADDMAADVIASIPSQRRKFMDQGEFIEKAASERSAVEAVERRAMRQPVGKDMVQKASEANAPSPMERAISDDSDDSFEDIRKKVQTRAWALRQPGGEDMAQTASEADAPSPVESAVTDGADDGFKEIRNKNHSVLLKVEAEASANTRFVKNHCCTYLVRLHTLAIFDLTLFAWEEEQLMEKAGMRPRAVQIVCWRRSVLEVSCVCYFLNLCFSFSALCSAAMNDREDYRKGKVFGLELGDYADHFTRYILLNYFDQGATIFGHALALIFCIVALLRWKTWAHSVRWTCYAYALGYVTPFVLLMMIPFHWGVDMKSMQQQFCEDILNGAPIDNSSASWGPAKLVTTLRNSGLPGTERFAGMGNSSILGLRAMLESKGIILPSSQEFCTKNPEQWEGYVNQLVNSMGRMADEAGGCVAAPRINTTLVPRSGLPDLTANVSAATQKCQQQPCDRCGTEVCLALLPTLQMALSATRTSSLAFNSTRSEQTPTSAQQAFSTWGLDANPAFSDCVHCVDELPDAAVAESTGQVPTCASLCLPLWATGQSGYNASSAISKDFVQHLSTAYTAAMRNSQRAMDAAKEAQNARICINTRDLIALEVLLQFASSTRPFNTILGIRLAMRALAFLLPTNFAMMFGALKGACISKTTVPYSRVPGIIVITAVAFSLPHLALLVILIKSVLGDLTIMCALSFFLFSNIIWLPFGTVLKDWGLERYAGNGLMEPSTHNEAANRINKRQRLSMFCYILMVAFLIVWFFVSEDLRDFMEIGFAQHEWRDLRRHVFSFRFWMFAGLQGAKFFTSMYGLTKISMVFFADVCVYTLLLVDEVDNDPKDERFRQEHGDKEDTLFLELHEDLQTDRVDLDTLSVEWRRFFKGRFKTKSLAKKWNSVKSFTNKGVGALHNELQKVSSAKRVRSQLVETE